MEKKNNYLYLILGMLLVIAFLLFKSCNSCNTCNDNSRNISTNINNQFKQLDSELAQKKIAKAVDVATEAKTIATEAKSTAEEADVKANEALQLGNENRELIYHYHPGEISPRNNSDYCYSSTTIAANTNAICTCPANCNCRDANGNCTCPKNCPCRKSHKAKSPIVKKHSTNGSSNESATPRKKGNGSTGGNTTPPTKEKVKPTTLKKVEGGTIQEPENPTIFNPIVADYTKQIDSLIEAGIAIREVNPNVPVAVAYSKGMGSIKQGATDQIIQVISTGKYYYLDTDGFREILNPDEFNSNAKAKELENNQATWKFASQRKMPASSNSSSNGSADRQYGAYFPYELCFPAMNAKAREHKLEYKDMNSILMGFIKYRRYRLPYDGKSERVIVQLSNEDKSIFDAPVGVGK